MGLVLLAGLLVAGCGGGEDATVPERSTRTEAQGADDTRRTGDGAAITATAGQTAAGDDEEGTAAPAPTSEEATEPVEPATQVDWRNTTYLMSPTGTHSAGRRQLRDVTFKDAYAVVDDYIQIKAITARTDPGDPRRAAVLFAATDSEGFPIFLVVGIYRADGTSGSIMEATGTVMNNSAAAEAYQCSASIDWSGGDELTVEVQSCSGPAEPSVQTWRRDGAEMIAGEVAPGSGADGGSDAPPGTIDVTAYGEADFVSPSGRISCRMEEGNGGSAVCEFPAGMDETGVPGSDHCGGYIGLIGVGVADTVGWICSGGQIANPDLRGTGTDWFADTGWQPLRLEPGGYGYDAAVLPYGSSLTLGTVTCSSARDGIRCSRSDSGAGFTLARAGVQRHGPRSEHFTGWG